MQETLTKNFACLSGMASPFSLVALAVGLLRTLPSRCKPALLPLVAEYLASTICMHLAAPTLVYGLLNSAADVLGLPQDALQPHIQASLRGVLAAMADGRVEGHACMLGADVRTAGAAVLRCLPAIAAGKTSFHAAADQASPLLPANSTPEHVRG